jgi:PAS domain S-box-containing protein
VQTVLGHTVESLQGTPFTRLLSDEGVDTFEQARRALEQTGLTQKITLKLRHTDRHSVWVEATMWQPGSDAGPGHGVVLTVHDVSQHRKYQLIIEELHQRNSLRQQDGDYQQPVTSQTFLDQTSEAVVIADADGQIQSVNRSFCEITGYTAQEVIGHNPSILQSGIHTAHFYEALWRSLSEKGRWKGEIWNRRKNGEVYPQLGSISIVRNDDGSLRNYVAVFSDVSKTKEAETNLFLLRTMTRLQACPTAGTAWRKSAMRLWKDVGLCPELPLCFWTLTDLNCSTMPGAITPVIAFAIGRSGLARKMACYAAGALMSL